MNDLKLSSLWSLTKRKRPVCQILEKIINRTQVRVLEQQNLMVSEQSGFRKKRYRPGI